MRLDDPITGLLVRLEGPDASFGCTAESDPITSRHHVNPDAALPSRTSRSACRLVVDLGLRYEMSELAFERDSSWSPKSAREPRPVQLMMIDSLKDIRSRGVSNLLMTIRPP